ncbi:MAG: thiamine diphosphokinase [Anaerolineae bacterium]|nr:thiamine diphosphokinase [Anaerolineae bacterium]MDW8071247.1 thiamine diphosphokinase [Anaerolineae bacterium]
MTARHVVILANGQLLDLQRARRAIQAADRLICADAGAAHAIRLEVTPDVVVGDLDSLDPAHYAILKAAGVRFEVHPQLKDKTDLELALQLAVTEGAQEIDLLGTQGGRLDQTLGNVLLLARPEWATVQMRILEGDQTAWVLRGGQECVIHATIGDTLSLLPLTPQVHHVTLSGVRWPLHNHTLHFGDTLTLSNVLTQSSARVEAGTGILLIVHQGSLYSVDFCQK